MRPSVSQMIHRDGAPRRGVLKRSGHIAEGVDWKGIDGRPTAVVCKHCIEIQ